MTDRGKYIMRPSEDQSPLRYLLEAGWYSCNASARWPRGQCLSLRRSVAHPWARVGQAHFSVWWRRHTRGEWKASVASIPLCARPPRCRRDASPSGLLFLGVVLCSWGKLWFLIRNHVKPHLELFSCSHFHCADIRRKWIFTIMNSMRYGKCEMNLSFALPLRTLAVKVRSDG